MAYVDWRIKGPELSTCSCDWGCPCQFNELPSKGYCRAAVAMRIDEGHFGDVRLDGLHWVSLLAWPGAIHHGNGECQAIVDERADERQREAILTILSGEETAPAATIFNALAATLTKVHQPQFKPILFAADIEARVGHFSVPGVVEARAEPILNPVTKAPAPGARHPASRIRVHRGGVRQQRDQDARPHVVRVAARPCPFRDAAPDPARTRALAPGTRCVRWPRVRR